MWRRSDSVSSCEFMSPWNAMGRPSFLRRPSGALPEPPDDVVALASAAAAAAAAAADRGGGIGTAPVSASESPAADDWPSTAAGGSAWRAEPEREMDIARVRLAALPNGIAGLQDDVEYTH